MGFPLHPHDDSDHVHRFHLPHIHLPHLPHPHLPHLHMPDIKAMHFHMPHVHVPHLTTEKTVSFAFGASLTAAVMLASWVALERTQPMQQAIASLSAAITQLEATAARPLPAELPAEWQQRAAPVRFEGMVRDQRSMRVQDWNRTGARP